MATPAQQDAEIARLQTGGRRLVARRVFNAGRDVLVKDSRTTAKNTAKAADAKCTPGKWKQYVIGAGAGESQAVFP